MTDTMRALIGGAAGPSLIETARPVPAPPEVLVRVRAASLNRIDLLMSRGGAHGDTTGEGVPFGVEWAGEIVELGAEVTGWKVGDRVMAAGPRAFADYNTAHAMTLYPVPDALSFEDAAGLPVGLQTMLDALVSRGDFVAGQSVLVQGASSAMGLIGLQLATTLGAGVVIGTSTTQERRDRLAEFGADVALDSRQDDFAERVRDATGGLGVDLTLDLLAGPYINTVMAATRVGGRIVNIGRMAGESGEFDFDLHSLRQISYLGTTFRTRSPFDVVQVVARTNVALSPLVAAGKIRIPVDHRYPVADFRDAFAQMAENRHFGKIVLSFD